MSKRSDAVKAAAILERGPFKWRACAKGELGFATPAKEKAWRDGDNFDLTVDGALAGEVWRNGKDWHWVLGGEIGEGKWSRVLFYSKATTREAAKRACAAMARKALKNWDAAVAARLG